MQMMVLRKRFALMTILTGLNVTAHADMDALRQADEVLTYKDGRVEKRTVALTRQADGAWRYERATRDMTDDMLSISVANAAGCVPTGSLGWWMLNDGRWGAFTRNDGKRIVMPLRIGLFGMKRGEAQAWVAIVKGLRLEAENVLTVSNGVYTLGARVRLPAIGFRPYENFIIDFYELTGDDASYSGMGRLYRKYQLDRGWVKPLKERARGNAALTYAADSVFMRYKFGRCDRTKTTRADWLKGPMPPVLVEHTFDDFKDMMRRAKEIGIDKAEMCFVGFQQGGHDGPFPDLFPADERFGGQAKMKEACQYGLSLGYRMNLHINQNNFYRAAKRWNLADVAKDAKGDPLKYTIYPAGQVYRSCWEVVCNKYCEDDMDAIAALGCNGLFHVDVTSAILPGICHDPRHPHNRREMTEWQIKTCEKARKRFGGYSSECGIDHIAGGVDNVLYASSYPGWHSKKTEIVDGYFPVWHIVYSGIQLSTPFYATIDAPCVRDAGSGKTDAVRENVAVTTYLDTPARRTLKVFELNGRPMFYYTDYEDLRPIKAMYDRWQPLKHLQYEFLDDHREIAADVFRMRYANGEETVANYGKKPYTYKGITIPPEDIRIIPKPKAAHGDHPVVMWRFASSQTCTRETWRETAKAFAAQRGCCDDVWFSTGESCPPVAWHSKHAAIVREAAEDLRKLGYSVSLQYETTIGHGDDFPTAEERAIYDKPWTGWTGPDGTECRYCSCPRQSAFHQRLKDVSALYAPMRPACVWIDDDMRPINHRPVKGNDGPGCWCKTCVAAFAAEDGHAWTRETLHAAWKNDAALRDRWYDFTARSMAEVACTVAQAFRAISPETRIGLQTASMRPRFSAIVMRRIYEKTGIKGGVRIGGGAYYDLAPFEVVEKSWRVAAARKAMNAEDVVDVWCTEIETYPRAYGSRSARSLAIEAFLPIAWGFNTTSVFAMDRRSETDAFYERYLLNPFVTTTRFLNDYCAASRNTEPAGFRCPLEETEPRLRDSLCSQEVRDPRLLDGMPFLPGLGRSWGDIPAERERLPGLGAAWGDLRDDQLPDYRKTPSARLQRIRDNLSRTAPLTLKSPFVGLIMPRVTADGTLRTIALLGARLDAQHDIVLRIRTTSRTAQWHELGEPAKTLAIENGPAGQTITIPSLQAWNIGYLVLH